MDDVEILAEPGDTILGACQRAGQKLQTVCKGRGICGACRVAIDEDFLALLTPPSGNEKRLLHYLCPGVANNRLGCQIILDETLAGLRLKPAPLPIRTLT